MQGCKFWLVLSVFILNACSQQVSSIKNNAPTTLEKNDGYLLLSVDTQLNLKQLRVVGAKNFHLGATDLTKGKHYILVALPAGEYRFEMVKLNAWWAVLLKDGYWSFKVNPNQISYVGELQLKGRAPELENRSSMALQYLEKQHAELLKHYVVRYSGPGDDHYFEFVESRKGKHQ